VIQFNKTNGKRGNVVGGGSEEEREKNESTPFNRFPLQLTDSQTSTFRARVTYRFALKRETRLLCEKTEEENHRPANSRGSRSCYDGSTKNRDSFDK